MKKLLVLTALLLLSVAPAMAGSYVKGSVGYFSPTESDLDGSFGVNAAVGMDLKEQIGAPVSAELGIGYTAPEGSGPYNGVDVTLIPITLTGLYELPLNLPVALNVGAGIGMYMWDVDASGFSDDGTDFGFHVQAGAEYKLSDQLALIGELKWANVDIEEGGVDFDGGGTSVNVGAKLNF